MENIELPIDSRWTIIERAEDYVYPSSKKTAIRYACICKCGTKKIVHKSHLLNGSSKSCGCLNREISSTAGGTGHTNTRAYKAWASMKSRVKSGAEKDKAYRNVEICQRWLDNFLNFLEDLGTCPEGYELERIDTKIGYLPENCVWASETRQAQNRGKFSNNTSGYTGVCWSKEHNKWRVYLYRNKTRIEGGLFNDITDAVTRRQQLELQYPMEEV